VEEVKFELVEEANHSVINLRSPHAALMLVCPQVLTSIALQCHIIPMDLLKTKLRILDFERESVMEGTRE
jgi:hypothetical protein